MATPDTSGQLTGQLLSSRFLCQQLINRAAYLLDTGEWDAYARCFTVDGTLARPSDPSNPIVGRAAILQSLAERPPRRSVHIITNTFFDQVTGEAHNDVAAMTATSRALLFTGPSEGPAPADADKKMVVGTFVDRLVCPDGTWLFAERSGGLELKASWGEHLLSGGRD